MRPPNTQTTQPCACRSVTLPLGTRIEAKLSYRELNTLSDRFAAALAALGVHKGGRVAIMLPNLPQQVIAYFGVLKAGGDRRQHQPHLSTARA